MQISAKWVKDLEFAVTTESGHSIIVDGPIDKGGNNHGARPMELLLVSLAACSGIDVVNILKKGKDNVKSVEIAVIGNRREQIPAVFTSIDLKYTITGVKEKAATRAVTLSVEKYCSAMKMIENNTKVSWSVQSSE